ncbi:MAG TPA: nitroreductase family protein [Thiobacillus sp.]|nr:nitroreductase family protein [Thiobacillus sp.]
MSEHDVYQQRYLAHIARKRHAIGLDAGVRSFWDVVVTRHSQRAFTGRALEPHVMDAIYEAIRLAPSSCNRQAIVVRPLDRGHGEGLASLLVGGAGWLDDAAVVLLLFADMKAYKSPAEVDFMPYLDAGFVAQSIYLVAEALGVGACFVNPNIREANKGAFNEEYNQAGLRFCGAMALGYYDVRGPESPKRGIGEIFYPGKKETKCT